MSESDFLDDFAFGSAPSEAGTAVAELPLTSPAPAPPKPLGQRLIEGGILTEEQLEAALSKGSEKGLRLGEALLDMGFAREEDILLYIEQHLGVPATWLRQGLIDPLVVKSIPRPIAESANALALFRVRDTVTVAMSEPQDLRELITCGATIDAIRDAYRTNGGRTLLEEGVRLAEQERTSLEEVIRVAYFE